ncbi:RidA family protein [Streptomyces sp. NPDC017958]|uniref:RidA family protein n=1 Tax=Streptomyces sp. NPDC017958 TaxID=3365021 RepID=UPI0037A4761F
MSEPTRIPAPDGVAPSAQYSHVVSATGRLVAVSGQLALDEDGKLVGEGDPAAQARQVFENLRRCLAAAGAGFQDVVKLTYFVTDIAHLPAILPQALNCVRAGETPMARAAHIPDDRLPAASAVQVAALVAPEFLMEVEALAVVGG